MRTFRIQCPRATLAKAFTRMEKIFCHPNSFKRTQLSFRLAKILVSSCAMSFHWLMCLFVCLAVCLHKIVISFRDDCYQSKNAGLDADLPSADAVLAAEATSVFRLPSSRFKPASFGSRQPLNEIHPNTQHTPADNIDVQEPSNTPRGKS